VGLDRLDVTMLVLASVNVVVMLELVRRRRLHEKYALLWLAVGALGFALSLGRDLVDRLALAVGIAYGPTVLFLAAILFLLFVCVQLSMEISRLRDKTTRLAQEVGLLAAESRDHAGRRRGDV
jgi:hypothetical protein